MSAAPVADLSLRKVYFGCPLRYQTIPRLRDSFLRLLRVDKSPAASFELAASLARTVAGIIDDALDSKIQYLSSYIIFSSAHEDESKRVYINAYHIPPAGHS